MKPKHQKIITHLLRFGSSTKVSDEEAKEYIDYQSTGAPIHSDNPLLSCQKWKEFTIASLIEEAFEWWYSNDGWIYPLLASLENETDPITIKAVNKIIANIEKVGMLEFYMKHPATNKNKERLAELVEKKFSNPVKLKQKKKVKTFKLKGYDTVYTVEEYLKGRRLTADISPGLDAWIYTGKWPEENNHNDKRIYNAKIKIQKATTTRKT